MGTSRLLRSLNDRTTLDMLIERGPLSRADIGATAGFSKPTTGQSLSRLGELGLVTVTGSRAGHPGPAAQIYGVDPTAAYGIAVDIGEESVHAQVVSIDGNVLSSTELEPGGRDVVTLLGELHTELIRGIPVSEHTRWGLTLAVQGVYNRAADLVRHGGHPSPWVTGLDEPGVAARIAAAIPVDVTIENDVKLVALAESGIGAAAQAATSVVLWSQGGVGSAAVIDGRLHRGATGSAGELGFLPVPGVPMPMSTDLSGGFQELAGHDMIVQLGARRGFAGTAADILEAARASDRGQQFLDEIAERYATGISALVAILDPDVVVLSGSDLFAGGDELAGRIAGAVAAHAMRPVPVTLGTLQDTPVLAGATYLVRHRLHQILLDRVADA